MNAPPPSPLDCGSTRPSTACTATAPSAAVPPARMTSQPALLAYGLAVTTMYVCVVPTFLPVRYPDAAAGAAGSPGKPEPTTTDPVSVTAWHSSAAAAAAASASRS